MKRTNASGFTLIELMIAVVVVAILAMIAYPAYQEQVRKTRRADGKAALMELSQAMERYFTENNTYDGASLGGQNPIYPSTSPEGYYNLSIQSATATGFTLRATPPNGGAQDGDGFLELDSTGAKRWDKNNDGDTNDAGENSWD